MKIDAAEKRSEEQAQQTQNRFGNSGDVISSKTKVSSSTSRSKGGTT